MSSWCIPLLSVWKVPKPECPQIYLTFIGLEDTDWVRSPQVHLPWKRQYGLLPAKGEKDDWKVSCASRRWCFSNRFLPYLVIVDCGVSRCTIVSWIFIPVSSFSLQEFLHSNVTMFSGLFPPLKLRCFTCTSVFTCSASAGHEQVDFSCCCWQVPKVTNKCTLKLRSHGFFGSLISNPITWVLWVTDFKSKVSFDLRGCLVAAVASKI